MSGPRRPSLPSRAAAPPISTWVDRTPAARSAFGVLLLLAMAMAALIQYAVAALAPFLVEDLALSRTEIGGFTSVMFVVAAVTAPLLGRLVDRLGPRSPLLGQFVLGGIATVVLASATGFGWLLAAAAIAGLPMAQANPLTNQLVSQHLPPGRRGLLMGIKQSGVKVGQVVSGSLLPLLAVLYGWRAAVLTLVTFSIAGLALALRTVPTGGTPPSPAVIQDVAEGEMFRLVRLLSVYAFFMGAGQAAIGSYLPLYAFEHVGLTATAAGAAASVMGAAGIAARIGWARPAERARSVTLPLLVISCGAFLAGLVLIMAARGGTAVLYLGAALFGATAPVWNVVAMLAVIRRVREHAVGRATSVLFVGFSIGFIVGPVTFGAVVDATSSYVIGWYLVLAAFVAAGVVAVLARRVESRRWGSVRGCG